MPRALDLLLTVFFLALSSPILLFLVAVLFLKHRKVFYLQERVGKDMRPFRLIKLCTMNEARSGSYPNILVTAEDDPRVHEIGRMLRGTHLDELPQLWNVVRGEMSLVGPRPEVSRYVEYYSEQQKEILFSVRPGLFGKSQLRSTEESKELMQIDPEKREEYYVTVVLPGKIQSDCEYVKGRSLAGDLKILMKSLRSVLLDLLKKLST